MKNALARRSFLKTALYAGGALVAAPLFAAEGPEGLKEPVFRVSKIPNEALPPEGGADQHPLDPALAIAHEALDRIQKTVDDYTCTIIKRERIKGVLGNHEFMSAKIRNRKLNADGTLEQGLSVYLNFLKPDSVKGREVIWVEGKNNGKMRAHEGGLKGRILPSVWLDPDGPIAMNGQLHPIYDIGIENLITQLIVKGERDRKHGECEVKFTEGVKINGRVNTLLEVRHPVQRPHFEFHLAQIFIDNELNLPVRYAAYHWPTDPNDKNGPVLEEYTYVDMKLNQGLTDVDFDSENPNYNF